MAAPRDPRDIAIDQLVRVENTLARAQADVQKAIKALQDGGSPDRRKHVCPQPSCGIRFYREDQLADHLELVHQVGA